MLRPFVTVSSKLTVSQQYELMQLAAIGVLPFDGLVSLGFSPTEADEMCEDREIIDIHRRGRSEGATKVRKALVKAGEKGSVSAIKALNMHRTDDDSDAEIYASKRKASGPAVRVDTYSSVTSLFERLRELQEGVKMESKIVNLRKKKVPDHG
jgi:hypothetical protein